MIKHGRFSEYEAEYDVRMSFPTRILLSFGCAGVNVKCFHSFLLHPSVRSHLHFMQCHGGLKGPLRRIIRSLGNDSVGSSCRSYPQRHLTGSAPGTATATTTIARELHSPPKRCISQRDRSRGHPGAPAALGVRSSRLYATQCSQLASQLEPEQKEYASNGSTHNDRSLESIDRPADPTIVRNLDAPVKDSENFPRRYLANYRRVAVGRMRKQLKAHEMQQGRHGYESSDDWRVILRILEDSTVSDTQLYKKQLETVMLPEGVVARFNRNAGVSLREIMEHTGCHVQVARGAAHRLEDADSFAGLDLLGSSRQITHALEILPRYIDATPTAEIPGTRERRHLNDHFIEDRSSEEDAGLASLSTAQLYQEYDSMDKGDVERNEEKLDQDTGTVDSVFTPLRSVWVEDRTRKCNLYKALDKSPRSLSSPLDVSAYVADLCHSVPVAAHRILDEAHSHSARREHVQVVTDKLVSLFSNAAIAGMATSFTVDRAIAYFAKHSDLAAFRQLYKALEDGGYVFTASNWNRCLSMAAKAGDVHNYRYTLKVMLRHGVKPDPVTWTTFHDLMCRRFPRHSSSVAETMSKKGLLHNHRAAGLIAENAVSNDLKAHLASNNTLGSFLRQYDSRFTSTYGLKDFKWFNVDVVNRMCAVLLSLGKSHGAFDVLEEFRRRNGEAAALDTVTLNTFLTSSLRDMNPASAVAVLQHFHTGKPGSLVPNNVTYAILFSIAWRRKYFNMLRVIWRYACVSGHPGNSSRYRIKSNLITSLSESLMAGPNLSRERVWHVFAAKFAVGIAGGSRRYREDLLPEGTRLNPFEFRMLRSVSLGRLKIDDPEYRRQRRMFSKVFTDDLAEAGLSRPVLPLADLLKSAWERDRAWKERGLGLPKTYSENMFREMLEDGIEVPMETGDGTLEIRAWEVKSLLRQNPGVERGIGPVEVETGKVAMERRTDDGDNEEEHVTKYSRLTEI